jgi:5-methyltetrahydrofolate--homocysteine methyltransferase
MTFVYDLMDRPAQCHRWLRRINDLYHPHYDAFYDIVKDDRGASMFTAFLLWGPGKTCKVQCDFAALMSPALFDEFYVPYVTAQIAKLDRVLYHLDGPDAIVHVDSLLKIKGLRAIQWVSGAGKPPNDDERWFQLYEKILAGGKALQISVSAERVEAIIRRLGSRGLYLLTGVKSEREARDLIALAKRASQGPRRRPARQP